MADPLDLIAQRESGGKPYVGWGGVDLSAAPLDKYGFPIWDGRPGPQGVSHAAGLYQIQPGTWRPYAEKLGVTDFSPASQRRVAEAIYADQGYAPWSSYNPRLAADIGQSGPVEGAYDPSIGAVRVHVYPRQPEEPSEPLMLLDALLGRHETEQVPAEQGNALLDQMLLGPQGSPQASGTPSGPTVGAETTNAITAPLEAPQRAFRDVGLPSAPPSVPPMATLGPQPTVTAPGVATPGPQAGGELLDELLGIGSAHAAPPPLQPTPTPTQTAPSPPMPAALAPTVPDEGGGGALLDKMLAVAGRVVGITAPALTPPVPLDPSQNAFTRGQLSIPQTVGQLAEGLWEGIKIPGEVVSGERAGTEEDALAFLPMVMGGAPAGTLGTGVRAGDAVRNLFHTPEARAAKTFQRAEAETARGDIREAVGNARRRKAQETAAVEELRRLSSSLVPDFERYIREVHAGGAPPPPAAMRLLDYMQGVGKLAPGDGTLVPMAKALRSAYDRVRTEIESEIENFAGRDDYVRQMWVETKGRGPNAPLPDSIRRAGRQGSGASLKEHKIPTISEGINAGRTPAILDPIENMLHYVSGMEDFLAWNRAHRIGVERGHISPTSAEGLVPLDGRLGGFVAPGYARIWNNYIGKGFHQWPAVGAIYDKALHAVNTVTAAKLGLSGYHAYNIAQETAVAGLSNAFGLLRQGELAAALKEAGYSATVIPKLVQQMGRGKRLQEAYLDMSQPLGSTREHQLADLYAAGGGRATGRGGEYNASAMENYWRAWKRGSLGMELKTGMRDILGKPGEAPVPRALMAVPRTAGLFAREMGRIMQTVSAPLFDTMIPRIKFAAWADEMEAWFQRHPTSTAEEQMAESRRLIDSMDDRFGEMIQDNLFWNRLLKQSLNMSLVSVGWEYGSLRAFGGAVKDIAQGKIMSPRARWLYAFPVIMGISGAAYQYLKTGKPPEGAEDLGFPQSGGTTPEGQPERALLPGYEKDPVQWFHELFKHGDIFAPNPQGLVPIMAGKLNPAMKTIGELATNKNWMNQPITGEQPLTPGWFKAYAKHVLEAYTPIPLQQEILKGSNIGRGERFGGIRPAPAYIEDPQRADDQEVKRDVAALQAKLRGLYGHGRRTMEEEQALRVQGDEIRQQIRKLMDDYRARKIVRQKQPGKVPALEQRLAPQ